MLAIDDPCLVFALARESAAFRREFRPQQRFPDAPCWAWFCGPAWLSVLVLHAGDGRERMETINRWLAEPPRLGELPYRPKLVLSAGFSGALQKGLKVGDIILATEVVEEDGSRWPTTWPGILPPGEWRPPLHPGRVLTVSRLIATPTEKRQLSEQYRAVAVDMEAAALARFCTRQGIPFGCVRAISDDVDTSLSPALNTLLANGRVSLWRTVLALLHRPQIAGELWRLARHTRHGAKQLALALGELLTLTLPWSGELNNGLEPVPVG